MYEVFKIKPSKPTPKNFRKTSLILKNPKFCNNPKNLGHKAWNAWKRGLETYQVRKNLIKLEKILKEEV